jgi:glycerophosphoryl diester phosphodiesterase
MHITSHSTPRRWLWVGVALLACCGLGAALSVAHNIELGPAPASAPAGVAAIRAAFIDPASPEVVVVAHRGHVKDQPENSLGAIQAAIDAGVHVAEIDIAQTSDGVYVLMHDATLNRTTTGKGKLLETTYAQLGPLQLLDNGIRPTTQRVPTLDQAFEVARGKILLNLDPKDMTIPQAADLARRAGLLDHAIFKQRWSKLDAEFKAWLKANPDVLFMPICEGHAQVEQALLEHRWPVIEVIFTDLADPIYDPKVIAAIRAGGTKLWINTLSDGRWSAGITDRQGVLDPTKIYGDLIDRGFAVIQTDLPEIVLEVARARRR